MRLGCVLLVAIVSLLATAAQATMFNIAVSSGTAQFAGLQASRFGPTVAATDVDLTPGTALPVVVNQFSGFLPSSRSAPASSSTASSATPPSTRRGSWSYACR